MHVKVHENTNNQLYQCHMHIMSEGFSIYLCEAFRQDLSHMRYVKMVHVHTYTIHTYILPLAITHTAEEIFVITHYIGI